MTEANAQVIYIGGYGRSGSTLLQRVLGSIENHVAIGELCYLWREEFIDTQLCGCGTPFSECEFWTAVMDDAFGGFAQIDRQRMTHLWRSVQSKRHLPLLAFPHLRSISFERRLREYTDVLRSLYLSIAKVAGCQVIIDSSKLASYAFALSETPGVDLNVIHLVRDSRACAFSWQRTKAMPDAGQRQHYLHTYNALSSAMIWSGTNALLGLAASRSKRPAQLRYEDFTIRPRESLAELGQLLSRDWREIPCFTGSTTVLLPPDHTVAGNPNRFDSGIVAIRPDDEWTRAMHPFHRLLNYTLTWPLLSKYGYIRVRPDVKRRNSEGLSVKGGG
jgi:hypothetical protein